MKISFDGEERWIFDRGIVMFWAETEDDQLFRCVVSREAIADAYGGAGNQDDSLRLFRENRRSFEEAAADLIRRDQTVEVPGESFREGQIFSARAGPDPHVGRG